MALEPVPNHQQPARNVSQKVREKFDYLRAANAAWKEAEVEVPPRYARHGGQGLPVEVVLQDWGLTSWSPSAATMRPLAQSAFVDEDDGAALFFGVFFISGQRSRFHC